MPVITKLLDQRDFCEIKGILGFRVSAPPGLQKNPVSSFPYEKVSKEDKIIGQLFEINKLYQTILKTERHRQVDLCEF